MKNLATILCVGIIGFAQAQSTSRDVEIYERYENGELVEQRQSATENGVPIENFDFDKLKRDFQLKFAGMDQKMEEMQRKMDLKAKEMDKKIQDFEKRSQEMQQRMEQKMNEMDSKSNQIQNSEKKKAPVPSEKPTVGKSTKDTKFT